jgi:hypothetical protein
MEEAFCYWPENSVGDIMYMLMQALEVSKTLGPESLVRRCFLQSSGSVIHSRVEHRPSSEFNFACLLYVSSRWFLGCLSGQFSSPVAP